jgi:hypothetical protein
MNLKRGLLMLFGKEIVKLAKTAGKTYEEYVDAISEKALGCTEKFDASVKNDCDFYRLNFQRISRINKTYRISAELRNLLQEIPFRLTWVVISEDWCGDSAQVLPYLAKITESSDTIEMLIISRDQHPDVMEQYLTDGKKSIPKLIAFDENGNELFTWGPRPLEAAELVKQVIEKGGTKEEMYQQLHSWYAKNRGKAVETEIYVMLAKVVSSTVNV